MRELIRIVLIALFVFMAQVGFLVAQKSDIRATDVKEAAKLILSNSPKPEEVNRGLLLLFDAASKIAAQDARLPAEFRNKLQTAARAFSKEPLGAEGSDALNAAYKTINGGKDFTFPNGVKNIADANRIAQQHIESSAKAIKSGQSDQAVRDILAFILLVTTPIMKQP